MGKLEYRADVDLITEVLHVQIKCLDSEMGSAEDEYGDGVAKLAKLVAIIILHLIKYQ